MLITGADAVLNSTKKLIFDGFLTAETYIHESANDRLQIVVGGDTMLDLNENTDVNAMQGSLKISASTYMTEQASALSDTAGQGQ